ncbi:hypothetical protein [Brevibacillus choshinensis]|nr:hypothetical protein [Brevibacillus choshinensis]
MECLNLLIAEKAGFLKGSEGFVQIDGKLAQSTIAASLPLKIKYQTRKI